MTAQPTAEGTDHFAVARPRWAIGLACGTVFHTNADKQKVDQLAEKIPAYAMLLTHPFAL